MTTDKPGGVQGGCMDQGTKPKVKINGIYVKMEVCPKFLRALREMGDTCQVKCEENDHDNK